jgi:copper transport protein
LQSLRQLTSVSDLLSTGWGRYLLVKLAVVLGVLALAYRARRWTHRHAASRTDPPYEPAPATLRTMRRTLVYEASVGVVVLALSAMLAGSAPPSDRAPGTTSAPRATAASPAHLHATYDTGSTGGSGTATALLTPAANGAVTVAVTLTTSASTPAEPAELTASLTLPALHIGPLPLDLTPTTPGHWTGTATLTPKGDWQLALTIRTSDIDEATVTFPPTPL